MRFPVGVTIIGVAAAHAALLWPVSPTPHDVERAARTRSPVPTVPMVLASIAPGSPEAPAPREGSAAPVRPPVPTAPTAAPPARAAPELAPAPTADPVFLPRHLLTRGPRPEQPVILPYPNDAPLGHWRARMTLYIDAEGTVRRVVTDPAPPEAPGGPENDRHLPPALEDSARQAYLQARFIPGERDGHAVACRLTVEVEFEASPTGGPTQAEDGPGAQDSLKVATLSLR